MEQLCQNGTVVSFYRGLPGDLAWGHFAWGHFARGDRVLFYLMDNKGNQK